jgi:hypothetical protein
MANIPSHGPAIKITIFHSASTDPRGASPATTLYNPPASFTTSYLAQVLLVIIVIIHFSRSTAQTNLANRPYATLLISSSVHSKSTSYSSSSILDEITILRPFDSPSRLFHTESKETTVSDA